jgi:hypothetical protein
LASPRLMRSIERTSRSTRQRGRNETGPPAPKQRTTSSRHGIRKCDVLTLNVAACAFLVAPHQTAADAESAIGAVPSAVAAGKLLPLSRTSLRPLLPVPAPTTPHMAQPSEASRHPPSEQLRETGEVDRGRASANAKASVCPPHLTRSRFVRWGLISDSRRNGAPPPPPPPASIVPRFGTQC